MEDFFASRFYQFLSLISTIIIPIVGFLVSYFQIRDARTEKKIRNFKITSEITPEDRGEYVEHCLALYKEKFQSQIRQRRVVVRNLLYKRSWMQSPDSQLFHDLNDIEVEITDQHWEKHPPRAAFLPYPREGFAANRKYGLSGNSSKLFNGKLFALESLSGDLNAGNLRVSVKNGAYFDFLDSCEYLAYEMAYVRRVKRIRPPYPLRLIPAFSLLPNRSRVGDVFDLDNRFAGIGINTATILYNVEMPGAALDAPEKTERRAILLLHHRSSQVAEGIGAIHVIPAGSYQPIGQKLDSPFNRNMANTVYREFGEELLNIDELAHLNAEELLDEKLRRWKVLLLGFGIEPLNTKIEVLTTLQIDLALEENRRIFGNCRSLSQLENFFSTNYEGHLSLVPLERRNLLQYQRDPRMTPAGKELLSILLEHEDYFLKPPAAPNKKAEPMPVQHQPCWNSWEK
ncbi:MAG: hypothetical protein Q4B50_00970 [Bacillota bacterium]|nr:hypothetical protein [Bacillota bacterium]